MTTKELEALPINGGLVYDEFVTNGFMMRRPRMVPVMVLSCREEDYAVIHDSKGVACGTSTRRSTTR